LISDQFEVFHISDSLISFLIASFLDNAANEFSELLSLHDGAITFSRFPIFRKNTGFFGDSDSSLFVVTSDHSNSHTSFVTLSDSLSDAFTERILDTDHAQHDKVVFHIIPFFRDGFNLFVAEEKSSEGSISKISGSMSNLIQEFLIDFGNFAIFADEVSA